MKRQVFLGYACLKIQEKQAPSCTYTQTGSKPPSGATQGLSLLFQDSWDFEETVFLRFLKTRSSCCCLILSGDGKHGRGRGGGDLSSPPASSAASHPRFLRQGSHDRPPEAEAGLSGAPRLTVVLGQHHPSGAQQPAMTHIPQPRTLRPAQRSCPAWPPAQQPAFWGPTALVSEQKLLICSVPSLFIGSREVHPSPTPSPLKFSALPGPTAHVVHNLSPGGETPLPCCAHLWELNLHPAVAFCLQCTSRCCWCSRGGSAG